MFNIKLNSKDGQKGKIVYNAGIVHNIVALAVQEVEGAMPLQGKKNGISLYIEKDGIYADVSVLVKHGYNVPELAYRIQQSVKQSVENMVKSLGFSDAVVSVSVDSDNVNVFINASELNYDTALSIYNMMKNETGIVAGNIIIMPVYAES